MRKSGRLASGMARINPHNLPIRRSLFFWSPSAIKAMAMFPVTDFHLLGSRLVFQVTHLPWIGICIYSDKNLLTVMHLCSTADGHLKNKDLLMGRLLVFILATADAHLPHFLQCRDNYRQSCLIRQKTPKDFNENF